MQISKSIRWQMRVQTGVFVLLFLAVVGLLAWLSTEYRFQQDWTAAGRHTLAEASRKLVGQLQQPLNVTVYATEDQTVREPTLALINKFRRVRKDIELRFVNPDLEPETVRQLGITSNGEMVLEYDGRSEHLRQVSEQSFSNALQRLLRGGERWIVFLEGHGERHPTRTGNHDVSAWAEELKAKGFNIKSLNLSDTPAVPDNTTVLVLAGPEVNLLPGEVELIRRFVRDGGNLLWLADPGDLRGLEPLAGDLGVSWQPGTIVDPTTQLLGLNDPRLALVTDYPAHALTQNLTALTLFPQARGIATSDAGDWQGQAFLSTVPRAWAETGALSGAIEMNAGSDLPGPLAIGVAKTREVGDGAAEEATPSPDEAAADASAEKPQSNGKREQRVVLIGDGDFISNAYLGNGGNLDLGMNLVNWLSHDDRLIDIPAKTTSDRTLELTSFQQGFIGFGFLAILPLLLAGTGFLIWFKRRRR